MLKIRPDNPNSLLVREEGGICSVYLNMVGLHAKTPALLEDAFGVLLLRE